MTVSSLEQVKIQAQVLVPLVKALRKEMGESRANEFVRSVLGDVYRDYGKVYWEQQQSTTSSEKLTSLFEMFAGGGALDYQVIEDNSVEFDVNVTRCGYAEFFKELGEPELGFLLCCGNDVPMTDGFEAGIELERNQTIMQGASHCDFRFKHRGAPE